MRVRETISGRLLETLIEGRRRLGGGAAARVRGFVDSQRGSGGGFVGRGGAEDIYYTSFGWMLSRMLGARLDAEAMKRYLAGFDPAGADLVHYAAWARCVMLQKLVGFGRARFLMSYVLPGSDVVPRPPESVLERAPGGDPGSPYSRFVRLSLAEDSGRGIEAATEISDPLRDYRTPGGGYANVKGAVRATTNATAAAMMATGQLQGYRRGDDSRRLRELQDISGGFGAAADSPVPDLLSTATALFTLRQYGEQPKYPAADFVEGHWLPDGGFAATLLDTGSDVEYTFYGLLALGAL